MSGEGADDDAHGAVALHFAALWTALDGHPDLLDRVRAALDQGQSRLAEPSEIIGNTFRVEAVVYQGDRTQILRLRHRDLDTPYALKTLRPDQAGNPVFAELLRAEARKHLPLQHPNILRAHILLRLADGRPALLLDWMDGGSLSDRLAAQMPISDVEATAKALFRGLAAVHEAGLVHADLTPANLLFANADGGSLCIADFDIALSHRTVDGMRTQSPFAAPETLAGQRPDIRADLYACGRLLHLLLARHENAAPGLWSLARHLIDPDPEQRPKGAREALAELANA